VVESARRRNAEHKDVPDPAEFEKLMVVVEELGEVAQRAAAKDLAPMLVGRAMQFYAKAIAVPEAAP
jgi:hypothetical protein